MHCNYAGQTIVTHSVWHHECTNHKNIDFSLKLSFLPVNGHWTLWSNFLIRPFLLNLQKCQQQKTHSHSHEEYFLPQSKQMRSSSQGAAIPGEQYQEMIILEAVFAHSFGSASLCVLCVCVDWIRSAFRHVIHKLSLIATHNT